MLYMAFTETVKNSSNKEDFVIVGISPCYLYIVYVHANGNTHVSYRKYFREKKNTSNFIAQLSHTHYFLIDLDRETKNVPCVEPSVLVDFLEEVWMFVSVTDVDDLAWIMSR